jgi:c-di-GMP-binding flagellar brake protein YcgR
MSKERRRTTRIEIVQHVGGLVVPLRAHLRVREMSLGGMLIETTAELSPMGIHEFRLELSDGGETLVRGHIVHGRFEVKHGGVMYTLGVEFSFLPMESVEVIRKFILEIKADPFPTRTAPRA